MTLVKIKLDVKNAAYISANPTKVLALNEPIYRNDGLVAYGDGVTPLSGLTFLPLFSGGGIASVTGTTSRISVDATDPENPILNISGAYDTAITNAIASAVSGKEDTSNKQTDLTPSATKYPTVDAVNTGLALKANINPRVSTIASSTTPSINIDSYDRLVTTALSGNITTTTVTGVPAHGRCIIFETTDNGTARSINRGASFVAGMASLPITTLINKTLYEAYEYDSGINKWRCFATGINM